MEVAELMAAAGYEGLSRGVIAKLESGIRESLTMEEFIAWCAVLDVDPVALLLEVGVGSGEMSTYWEVTRTWCVRARSWEEAVSLAGEGRHAMVKARRLSGPPDGPRE